MKKLLVPLVVLLVFVSSSSLDEPAYLQNFGRFVILVHDVSPGYLPQLKQITVLIDAYGLQNETYLFVIPNHGGEKPLWEHPEFISFIQNLSARGYHIELHGYDHIGNEFDCSAGVAEERLELGLEAFESCNLSRPHYFIAPRYSLSGDALSVILSRNITVIGGDFVYYPNGTSVPVLNREYTWYLPSPLLDYQLESARTSYRNTRGTFFISIHPKAANNGAGLEFLRRFLEFVRKQETGQGLTGAS
ncbi:polysaccharide deacetylase [Thermococcus siculi]|uniref:Polysaccharide deacetylase n=1 Tax=Thermococcus siculi TaxID=72803 RepID=A0A2Z2MMW3_9EURY|nr:DUF2334 domain-containing protein [Thermococcus siculi]ASJ08781.1 polysaccharide deacetylase [Thermococcus siculi]